MTPISAAPTLRMEKVRYKSRVIQLSGRIRNKSLPHHIPGLCSNSGAGNLWLYGWIWPATESPAVGDLWTSHSSSPSPLVSFTLPPLVGNTTSAVRGVGMANRTLMLQPLTFSLPNLPLLIVILSNNQQLQGGGGIRGSLHLAAIALIPKLLAALTLRPIAAASLIAEVGRERGMRLEDLGAWDVTLMLPVGSVPGGG